ncbi:MAG: PQQ-binding-like beta-propeller repeat protein [Victivallales bacterium]|nr:PQQ-binding-like beta-propeller repeat protein [Victivallales bacterium]
MAEPVPNGGGTLRQCAAVLIAMALVFCAVAGAWLGAHALHEKSVRPANHKALVKLQDAAARHPRDEELKEAYRTLDVEIRTEAERVQAFRRRGVRVLGGGLLVLLLAAAAWVHSSPTGLGLPGADLPDEASERAVRRWGMVAGIVALAIFSCVILWPRDDGGTSGKKDNGDKVAVDPGPPPSFADAKGQWPAFRGVGAVGLADSSMTPPLTWDGKAGTNIAWKVKTPRHGFSSPILWDGKLFITGGDQESRDIYCYDAGAGTLLWTADSANILGSPAELPEVSEDTGFAAACPTTDGQRVYAIYATGDVLAVDFSGKRIWGRNLGPPNNPYGHASSLVVHRGRLLVQYDHFDESRLIALAATTGETLWEKKREVGASWGTPALATVGKRTEVYLNAEPFVMAFDAETGNKLWQNECMGGEVGPSPAYADGLAYFTTDYAMLAAIHTGGTDKDGTIAWQTEDELPDVSSPVAANGLVFVSTAAGIVSCYDAKTGKLHWRQEYEEGFYSSPVIAAGRVYLTDQKGLTHVFAATKEFKSLAKNQLGEPAVSTFAFRGKRAYLRGFLHLYCLVGKE